MTTYVRAKDGNELAPTTNIRKVRKLLRSGRAHIIGHRPFHIQLDYDIQSDPVMPETEICEDTGYEHAGLSVKSGKHEFESEDRIMLLNEKQRHSEKAKNRRMRRSRLRYRKPRFDNRKKFKPEGWIPPSLKNKADREVDMISRSADVLPTAQIYIECGQFDTQVLSAVNQGLPVPEGTGYQHGPTYGYDTLREAVFARDGYKCVVCGASGIPKGDKPGKILRIHHIGYLHHDRSNRMGNLATVCTDCHTPANHAPGGALYNLKPREDTIRSAAYMNTVRWYMYRKLSEKYPGRVHITYGAVTKRTRIGLNIEKSHANDAYCIGNFRPKHRCRTAYYKKVRRHNRILTKFHDAVYIDSRDGSEKKGAELPSGRTNRNHKLDTENLRKYRLRKVTKGRLTARSSNEKFRPGDVVRYKNTMFSVEGMCRNNTGAKLIRKEGRPVYPSAEKVCLVRHSDGWCRLW